MYKVEHVPAFFSPVFKEKKVKVPTGETTKGLFGQSKEVKRTEYQHEQTGWSDTDIDAERLADDMQAAMQKLESEGYEIISVESVLSGSYSYAYKTNTGILSNGGWGWGYGYGYGYSFTSSMLITAKKAQSE